MQMPKVLPNWVCYMWCVACRHPFFTPSTLLSHFRKEEKASTAAMFFCPTCQCETERLIRFCGTPTQLLRGLPGVITIPSIFSPGSPTHVWQWSYIVPCIFLPPYKKNCCTTRIVGRAFLEQNMVRMGNGQSQ